MRQHRLRELIDRGDRVAGGGGIGGVRLQEQRRTLAAHQPQREVRRNRYHELRFARGQHAIAFLLVRGLADVLEITAVLETRENAARKLSPVGDQRRGWQVLGVGVDRESEQDQLHHRNADDHAEGQPIALELNEFLADDAKPA